MKVGCLCEWRICAYWCFKSFGEKKKLEYSSVVAISRFHISTEGENINIRTSMKKVLITAW